MEGGTGSRSESVEQPTFRPDCYEAGTLNLHGIAGLRGRCWAWSRSGACWGRISRSCAGR